MIEFFRNLFSNDFMPHGMCYLWQPGVLWLNVISDGLIAAAYYAIPFLLFYFVKKRRDINFNRIFAAFGMFILACGSTHLLGALTVWDPIYRLEGLVKAVTAAASITTLLMMIPLMPVLIGLASPSELASLNAALQQEIGERRAAEAEIRSINEELEDRVARRTAEQRALEIQLIQAQKMEAVGRLAGGVAHDFNNLLTVIVGYCEMLSEHLRGDETGLEFAQEVSAAANRASALTNQLLAFGRRQVSIPRVVNLNEQLQEIQKMLGRIIGEDIRLVIRLAPALRKIEADPSHLDQVVMNLAVNSRDAMPEGGTLTLETANVDVTAAFGDSHSGVLPGSYVMLRVSDTGVGMDAATRARVFEPFFTTKEQGKGTGLGLSIVYGIVKQNHGEVVVDSAPGEGTVFRIYFPVSAALPGPVAGAGSAEPTAVAGETILLVEDEDPVRKLIRAMLEHRGYRVIDTDSAARALEFLRQEPGIDLLLTDVIMPQVSGAELVRQARKLRGDIRVLFMSGYADTGVVNAMLTKDARFIQKPFTAGALYEKIREILDADA